MVLIRLKLAYILFLSRFVLVFACSILTIVFPLSLVVLVLRIQSPSSFFLSKIEISCIDCIVRIFDFSITNQLIILKGASDDSAIF